MNIEAESIEDAFEFLKALCIDWVTVNKIENSLWDTGVAFFDRTYCRVAYYDEVNHMLSINKMIQNSFQTHYLTKTWGKT